jgi:thioredoxin reductase (NADPH)
MLRAMKFEYLVYALPMFGIWVWYMWRRWKLHTTSVAIHERTTADGVTEPVSLHPVIDPVKCIGCGSCMKACPEEPEHHVLGLISGKAVLIGPEHCIGHGACRAACPVDAITLVFGSERRGVDLPILSPTFETNVPGVFIAGELGGMGLIRNALEQGRQAILTISKRKTANKHPLDVVIVGAGPAGFAASLGAMQHKLRSVTVEQDSLGGCVFQYPRGKIVMTAPAELPLVGKVKFRSTRKEDLLEFWKGVEKKTGVQIQYHERVEAIDKIDGGYLVRTTKAQYRTANVLLAIGRRGTPRKLGVTGEELPKVVYRLIDPEQYKGQRVLVVGGGDSALEAAASIAELGGNSKVILSYRSAAFQRAKARNRERIEEASGSGALEILLSSNVKNIGAEDVQIEQQGKIKAYPNDAVLISAGGVLPTEFLAKVGVQVVTKYGTA